MDEALGRLADAAGIEARYWDIAGRLHETSSETARNLLSALGIPAATEREVAASLTRLEEEAWRETLPAAVIAAEGHEIAVPLRLPAGGARNLRWSLDLEGGEPASGSCNLDDLEIEATGVLDGASVVLRRLRLPAQPLGYHRLHVEVEAPFTTDLIVAPSRGYLPAQDRRYWGIATQLYALRSKHNWGIGDFSDLRALMEWARAQGADAVGVNPLHALFLDTPADASPYSPNSRLFLNPLYLDVTNIPDFAECALASSPEMDEVARVLRTGGVVNYPAVATAKIAILERLHAHFRATHAIQGDERGQAFLEFVAGGGRDLLRFANFQMLSEQFGTHDWTRWPLAAQLPDQNEPLSPEQAQRVGFFQYLQWQCAIQLGLAAAGRANGMAFGLFNDLAVSVEAASADHWANQDLFLRDIQVGAPPDPFNEAGQDWGIVPFNPRRLRATGYAYFIALLRANMRNAGALRIDHVMGWQRLFLIPAGTGASDGAYMRFPLDDLVAIAALESQRNRCALIGEDLGTVPAGFRERMTAANILSCRILYFERDGERIRRPKEMPAQSLVAVATHDLATLRGYWTGEDITAKVRLGILQKDEECLSRDERARDKQELLQALAEEGLHAPADDAPWTPQLADAVYAYLARSPALLFMVQMDDLANEERQVNLPGSTVEYPNWRRRLGQFLEDMIKDPAIAQTAAMISRERGTSA